MTAEIGTVAAPRCLLCGEAGKPLYRGLRDRLFAAPGTWALAQCPQPACGLLWLDPAPLPEDVHKAYESYYTHAAPRARGPLGRLFDAAKRGYLANHFGYANGVSLLDRTLGLLPGSTGPPRPSSTSR